MTLPLWNLSPLWLVIVNVCAWFVLHMAVAYGGILLPLKVFSVEFWLFHTGSWEDMGRLYERLFRVKHWKRRLPNGAAMLGRGFQMTEAGRVSEERFRRFALETCRSELVHWCVAACSLLFFLWNTPAVGAIMVVYGLLANGPCIIAQRYNRPTLLRLAQRCRDRGRGKRSQSNRTAA